MYFKMLFIPAMVKMNLEISTICWYLYMVLSILMSSCKTVHSLSWSQIVWVERKWLVCLGWRGLVPTGCSMCTCDFSTHLALFLQAVGGVPRAWLYHKPGDTNTIKRTRASTTTTLATVLHTKVCVILSMHNKGDETSISYHLFWWKKRVMY